jgi:hypothetical protein
VAEQSYYFNHNVTLVAQETAMTCWAAVGSMLLGSNRSPGVGGATLAPNGGLPVSGDNLEAYARANGFRLHHPQSWSEDGLRSLVARGPIGMCGRMPNAHCIVVGGIWNGGSGPVLKVYDPWPINVGGVSEVPYHRLMQVFPLATMYILQA